MIKKLCAWIVSRVDNRRVIHAFEILRKLQRLNKRKIHRFIDRNAEINKLAWKNHSPDEPCEDGHAGGSPFIENQRDFADMKFGKATMKYSGCEILAVYNLLKSIGGSAVDPDQENNTYTLPELISEFEADGMLFSGMFGTAPKALRDFLGRQGYETGMTTKAGEFNDFGERYDSLILTMFNNGHNVFEQVHTINISKEKEGLVAHNVYGNGRAIGPCATVNELITVINGGRAKGIALIGVKKKEYSSEI